MPTPTYDLIASNVLTTTTSIVTFSSIPATYRDLVLVFSTTRSSSWARTEITFNGSTTGYSKVFMIGDGSSATSETNTDPYIELYSLGEQTTIPNTNIVQIMDYSATDKHKTVLARGNTADRVVTAVAGRWANTSAINEIKIDRSGMLAGGTFYLYGIAS